MNKFMTSLLFLMFLVAIGSAHVAHAQPAASFDEPVKLRVTGTLHSNETPPREDLVMVNILVEDKPLLLRVGQVEELTRTERASGEVGGIAPPGALLWTDRAHRPIARRQSAHD